MNSNDYINVVSELSVLMSKFDVTRPSNFHEVPKTSILSVQGKPLREVLFVFRTGSDIIKPDSAQNKRATFYQEENWHET